MKKLILLSLINNAISIKNKYQHNSWESPAFYTEELDETPVEFQQKHHHFG